MRMRVLVPEVNHVRCSARKTCKVKRDSKREGKKMRRAMRTASLFLGTAMTVGVLPSVAQNAGEQVKVAFEHAIPNVEGKKMVAFVVTYPPGAKSLPHPHASSSFTSA